MCNAMQQNKIKFQVSLHRFFFPWKYAFPFNAQQNKTVNEIVYTFNYIFKLHKIISFCVRCASGVILDTHSCLDPGVPVNGIRYGQDLAIGSVVWFGCEPGYRLSHEEQLVCEKNHWWSHPLPTCDGKLSSQLHVSFRRINTAGFLHFYIHNNFKNIQQHFN